MSDDSVMVTVTCWVCGGTREERWSRQLAETEAEGMRLLREVVPDTTAQPYSRRCADCESKVWTPREAGNKEWW